jgi:hypothetical protein
MNKDRQLLVYTLLDALILILILFNISRIGIIQKDYRKEITRLNNTINNLDEENAELRVELLEYEEKYNELLSESCVSKQELIEPLKIYNLKEYYILYKEIEKEYANDFGRPLSIYDMYTEEDIMYIQKCVETECYDCPFEAKVNVANVIINRVDNENFPSTPTEVVTANNQFAYYRNVISEDTVLAVEYAFMFEDTTDGALYFHSGLHKDTFNGAKFIFEDLVGHKFYK